MLHKLPVLLGVGGVVQPFVVARNRASADCRSPRDVERRAAPRLARARSAAEPAEGAAVGPERQLPGRVCVHERAVRGNAGDPSYRESAR